MMDFEGERPGVPRLRGKPMALVLTDGGEEADNADLVIRGFEQLVHCLKGRMVGHLFVSGCGEPDAMGDAVKGRAAVFARTLVEATR
jgi:hypothetical protein